METRYGIRAEIRGDFSDGVTFESEQDKYLIEVKDKCITVGFEEEDGYSSAEKIARCWINLYALKNDVKLNINVNYNWFPTPNGGKRHLMSFAAEVRITGQAQGLTPLNDFDDEDISVILKHPYLQRSIEYYVQEVVDERRPMYGVYKSLECITHDLGSRGREKLARIANVNKDFVRETFESTQSERHAHTDAQIRVTNEEAKNRAKILIVAYVQYLKSIDGQSH